MGHQRAMDLHRCPWAKGDNYPQYHDTEWGVPIHLYTGITKDLTRRTQQHNDGTASRYTRSRLPVTLVYQERQRSQNLALKREAGIKRLARKQKPALIRGAL